MKPYQPDKLPLEKLDWRPFIRYIGPANAAIARYDGMLQAVLNPDLLLRSHPKTLLKRMMTQPS